MGVLLASASAQNITVASDTSINLGGGVNFAFMMFFILGDGNHSPFFLDKTSAGPNRGFNMFFVVSQNIVYVDLWGTGGVSTYYASATITPGLLYHIAFVYDGIDTKIYFNGVGQTTTATGSNLPGDSTLSLYLGRSGILYGNNILHRFNGSMADIRIYKGQTWDTASTIKTIFESRGKDNITHGLSLRIAGSGGVEGSVVSSLADISGKSNSISLDNSPIYTALPLNI